MMLRSHRPNLSRTLRKGGMLASLALAVALAGCSTELYSNLSEREANQMVQVLARDGIDATRSSSADGKFKISVASADFSLAVAKLSAAGLPRKDYGSLGEVFNADKLVSTPFEERARFMHALNEELAASLTEIDGVVSARVHINMPEQEVSLDPKTSVPRASVFIYQAAGVDLSGDIPTIKNLVVNSVPNLRYDAVTVALFTATAETTDVAPAGMPFGLRIPGLSGLVSLLLLTVLAIVGLRYSMARPKPANSALLTRNLRKDNS